MKNKELKKGGQIWIYSPYFAKSESLPIVSVKKTGTLVTVVIKRERFHNKFDEITLYGHASSSLLSGYDKHYRFGVETYYTCDFELIEQWTKERNTKSKYEEIGRSLKSLLDMLNI